MTLGRALSVALVGLEAVVVEVQCDIQPGLPSFTIGGLPDAACRQSADRVRSAAANMGVPIPMRRITVNLSPASVPKVGSQFDVAIAMSVLMAAQAVPDSVQHVVHLGELGLDGSVRPVPGVLPAVLGAFAQGHREILVPSANLPEASLVEGARVGAVATLGEAVMMHRKHHAGHRWDCAGPAPHRRAPSEDGRDLRELIGQADARRALEVVAAGGHHLCLTGPPGAGKTMMAECLPSILPTLSTTEALEVTAIRSLTEDRPVDGLIERPPFVHPHHSASMAAMVGGGTPRVRPGLVSQAHRGVLFLDEAPEFNGQVLQGLRQPMESGDVRVARARGTVRFPASFQLVLAANPCPCGHFYGKGLGCECRPAERSSYLAKLKGPLLDRVDVRISVPPVTVAAGAVGRGAEASADVAHRVLEARGRARHRWAATPWTRNAEVPGSSLRSKPWRLSTSMTAPLDRALQRRTLTLRGYDRTLRVAWTLADLAGAEVPDSDHIGEALMLRESAS